MGRRNGEGGQGRELGLLERIWQRQKEHGGVGAAVIRRGEQNAVDDPTLLVPGICLCLVVFFFFSFSWFACIFLNKILMACFYEF